MPDDELTFTVGAREIYDAVQAATAEVKALRDDHSLERAERAEKDRETDRKIERLTDRIGPLEHVVWQARGAIALGIIAIGWLIETKVIG